MINFENMPDKYEKGTPVKIGNVVGRLVGESPEGTWIDVNGITYWSVPLFATPHGQVAGVGIYHVEKLNPEDLARLLKYEQDVEGELYGGYYDPSQEGHPNPDLPSEGPTTESGS
jgi:hypothetical protein